MAYKRKVYCGYCGNPGHNRRGCPKLKEYISSNPDSYQARRAKVKAKQAAERGSRKCGYCGERASHNRTTCKQLKTDKANYIRINNHFRQKIFKSFKELGFGVGALVTGPRVMKNDGTHRVWMVTEILWNKINVWNWYRDSGRCPITIALVEKKDASDYDLKWISTTDLPWPAILTTQAGFVKANYSTREENCQIVSPAPLVVPNSCKPDDGSDFLSENTYAGGYAAETIEYIEEKLNKAI